MPDQACRIKSTQQDERIEFNVQADNGIVTPPNRNGDWDEFDNQGRVQTGQAIAAEVLRETDHEIWPRMHGPPPAV